MSLLLELQDSEVRRVAADGDTLRVEFSAAAVRRPGAAGGWLPTVVATLSRASWTGDLAHAFGRLAAGSVTVDGTRVPSPALQCTLTGAIVLGPRFANGTVLQARGQALALAHADDATLADDLSC